MAATRDAARTRRAILDAAAAEFSRRGPAGARIDAIAAAAGANKRMLYHYFESKEGLLAAVLEDSLGVVAQETDAPLMPLNDLHATASSDPDRLRLLMWEALSYAGAAEPAAIVAFEQRAAAWQRRVESVREQQREDCLLATIDAAQLELTFVAIALFPFAFPQLTRLITGQAPGSAEFVAARAKTLQALIELFTAPEVRTAAVPAEAPAETPKTRYRLTAAVTESATRSRGE